ncbi:hypothetical protein [Vibrio fluvialis]|uniref:hypothetical protein n=1 Tax=Vibrio fluvialis TaxID=676 RepID=UPI00192AB5C7|nr:hypothetical protein [Vibrio fluvialis]MBL4240752.1 hypothetical protein [Vibrio fluvialis]MBL4267426.1 hypothetical protein [Vibrio fluvialis]MBL4271857.1 hypothetical protein [Vibrio fluvialis]MBL4276219.1 hypothetical protein [Vibrio fluvialis]MBO1443100.1 hypothetical protein [Vibrio fluvialis]
MRSEQGTELGYQQTRYQHFDAPGQSNQLLLRTGYKFDQKEHLYFRKKHLELRAPCPFKYRIHRTACQ